MRNHPPNLYAYNDRKDWDFRGQEDKREGWESETLECWRRFEKSVCGFNKQRGFGVSFCQLLFPMSSLRGHKLQGQCDWQRPTGYSHPPAETWTPVYPAMLLMPCLPLVENSRRRGILCCFCSLSLANTVVTLRIKSRLPHSVQHISKSFFFFWRWAEFDK